MIAPNDFTDWRLSTLTPGQTGTVRELQSSGFVRRRLLDLGFCPGTTVEVLRRSPLGDPTSYRVRGTTVALRAQDAAGILVEAGSVATSRKAG